MSLYNMICGFSPACVILLPMLGRKADEYPRFRDCFISEDREHIEIYTRVGGGNRGCGYGEEALYKDPNFDYSYDDTYDSTYGTYVFNIPQKWRGDFDHIMANEWKDVSDEYVDEVKKFYPKLKDKINKIFER